STTELNHEPEVYEDHARDTGRDPPHAPRRARVPRRDRRGSAPDRTGRQYRGADLDTPPPPERLDAATRARASIRRSARPGPRPVARTKGRDRAHPRRPARGDAGAHERVPPPVPGARRRDPPPHRCGPDPGAARATR